jgi:hypothetical protein
MLVMAKEKYYKIIRDQKGLINIILELKQKYNN